MVVAKLAILPSPHTVWHHACNFCMRLFVGVAHCMMPCCMRRGVLSLGCSAKPSDRVQEGAQSKQRQQVLEQMRQNMLVPGTSDIHRDLRNLAPNALLNIELKDIIELDLTCGSPLARQAPCIYQLTCKWCRCCSIPGTICAPYNSTGRVKREQNFLQTLIISTDKTLPEQVQTTQDILCERKDAFVSDMMTAGLLLVLWRDVSKTTSGGVYRHHLCDCAAIDKVFQTLVDKLEVTLGGGLNMFQAAMYDLGTGSPPFVPAQTVLKQHLSVKQTSTTGCSQQVDVHQTAHVSPSMEVEQSASVSQEVTSEHGTSQQASAGDASGEQTVGVDQQVVEGEEAHT